MLADAGIEVVTHMIIGLPGETRAGIDETIDLINSSPVTGVKIHNLYIVEDTVCAKMYAAGQLSVMECEEYLDALEYVITHLRSDIVLHRISGDPPKEILIAPAWTTHKKYILNGIDRRLAERDLYQGMYYEELKKI